MQHTMIAAYKGQTAVASALQRPRLVLLVHQLACVAASAHGHGVAAAAVKHQFAQWSLIVQQQQQERRMPLIRLLGCIVAERAAKTAQPAPAATGTLAASCSCVCTCKRTDLTAPGLQVNAKRHTFKAMLDQERPAQALLVLRVCCHAGKLASIKASSSYAPVPQTRFQKQRQCQRE
ncbi:hypothetical protein COO60DRAFT_477136 [Scenedesmus sp. NREL 46B-D3]|nr:hypothetical protein COO60DRAFT_477136 [Scenedesmus sp. NREL 46B-D3]